MSFAKLIIALLGLSMMSIDTSAQDRFTVPSDDSYYVKDTELFKYIYSEDRRYYVEDLTSKNTWLTNLYEKEFRWKLDDHPALILVSDRAQVANGFVTVFPRLFTAYYGAGADLIDEFSVRSWLYVLLAHESAHLYQINVKRDYSVTLKNIFGVAPLGPTSIFPPFTYVMHPNVFLPAFLTEGNAVLNEGRFGNGGRLYNGHIRATFLQLAKKGSVTVSKLINEDIEFPYGAENYWVGGYFQLYLAEIHGVSRTNKYFWVHAFNNFNPFNINEAFLTAFKKPYWLLMSEFLDKWQPLYSTMVEAKEKPIFTSAVEIPMTKDENEIRAMSFDLRSNPILHIYNINDKKWTHSRMNIPAGRAFRDESGKIVVTSSQNINATNIKNGLFSEGYGYKKSDLGKLYYDRRMGRSVYADAKTSFHSPQLYLDGQFVSESHSSAILDNAGNVYYFKQNKKVRSLYKNKEKLFSYNGYYGKPVEILDNGDIYFIGPVERGTSLFLWSKSHFYRAHPSDVIVDARRMNDNSALITEVTAKNYSYKIVNLSPKSENPFEYNYFYEKDADFNKLDDPPDKLNSDLSTNATNKEERPYSSVKDFKFDGIDPFVFFGPGGYQIQTSINFSDPLQNHQFKARLGVAGDSNGNAGISYTNLEHIIQWSLLGAFSNETEYVEDPNDSRGYRINDRSKNWLSALGFEYPYFKRPQWSSSFSSFFIYQYEDPQKIRRDIDQGFSLLTQWNIQRLNTKPLAYSPYRAARLDLAHDLTRNAPRWTDPRNLYGAKAGFTFDIFSESYLTASYQSVSTDDSSPLVELSEVPDDFPIPSVTRINALSQTSRRYYFEVRKAAFEAKQAFNLSLYHHKFPIGLRRFAAVGIYNEYYGSDFRSEDPDTLFHESGAGGEFELLILHVLPLRVSYLSLKNSETKKTGDIFTLSAKSDF